MRKNTLKLTAALVVLAAIISIAPVVLSMPYARMALDDYVYASETHHIWVHTHSVLEMLKSAFAQIKDVYMNWNGSVIAGFFCAFHGGSFGEKYYFVNLMIHFAVFVYAIWRLSKSLLVSCLHSDRASAVIMFALIVFVSVQFVPDSTDAFFAYNLATMYTGYYSVMCIVIADILDISAGRRRNILYTIGACVMAFVATGGHLSIGVMLITFILCYWLYIILGRKKVSKRVILISLIVVAGFLINALAPGYRNRASDIDYGMSPVSSIAFSVIHGLELINKFTTIYTFCVIAVSAVLILRAFARSEGKDSLIYSHPVLSSAGLFGIYCSLFAANYYALGAANYPRLEDVGYFAYIWLMISLVIIFAGWLNRNKDQAVVDLNARTEQWFGRKKLAAVFLFGAMLVLSILSTGKLDSVLGINLGRRLLNGQVQQYSAARDAWIEECENNPGADIVVDDLPVYIDAMDKWHIGLVENEYNWVNGNIANYYEVKSFTVRYK